MLEKSICVTANSFMLLYLLFVSSTRVDVITDYYPTIISTSILNASYVGRIIQIPKQTWTNLTAYIILRNAEGELLFNNSLSVIPSVESARIPLTIYYSLIGCIVFLSFLACLYNERKQSIYIPDKERDKNLGIEFYN